MLRHRERSVAERGYAIALTGLMLLPLLAVAGLAVDLGGWYARAAAIQKAADAAALGGVVFLPQGIGAASTRAQAVAAQNGFANGGSITVTVAEAGARRLRVTITDSDLDQYFTAPFTGPPNISRSATAEYILPVPMGSPRNFLGTGNDPGNASSIPSSAHENFWVSVSGYCARREMGDRLTPRTDANGGSSFAGCVPGASSNPSGTVLGNPEFTASGYYYALEFDEGASGSYHVEIFDAPHCESDGSPEDSGTNNIGGGRRSGERRYRYSLHSPSLDYTTAPQIGSAITVGPDNCHNEPDVDMDGVWTNFFTITNPEADRYYLRIQPLEPTDKTGDDAQEGQNQLSIRVRSGSTFTPCSTDPTVSLYDDDCHVNVFGLTHLGVYASFVGSAPEFFLASIGPEHAGKLLEVELFDTAEGAERIRVLDPNRDPVSFTWEIACMDGSYRSDIGGSCTTGENPPRTAGGSSTYGPYAPDASGNAINVSGTVGSSNRPWGSRNGQNGRYSDRLIRLRIQIPDDYDDEVNSPSGYDGRTWWRIRYTTCSGDDCSVGDRTTWSVSVNGDPVRLVPNT